MICSICTEKLLYLKIFSQINTGSQKKFYMFLYCQCNNNHPPWREETKLERVTNAQWRSQLFTIMEIITKNVQVKPCEFHQTTI